MPAGLPAVAVRVLGRRVHRAEQRRNRPAGCGRRRGAVSPRSSALAGSPVVRPRKTSAETSEQAAAAALTLQFLDYIADGRTYGETMEAWRSTCPRMPIWEDAVRHGLVRIENGGAMNSSRIVLTAEGTARLGRAPTLPSPASEEG